MAEGKKKGSSLSLSDKHRNILEEIIRLKREADKARGYHVARGSREEYRRYSVTQAIEDIIDEGAGVLVNKLNKDIQAAKAANPIYNEKNILDGEEALRRKIMDLDGKGWSPIGGSGLGL